MEQIISGVILTPLKNIYNPAGNIYHCLKKTDAGFVDFGEAYFSTINTGVIKGWKKHLEATLNIVVPRGQIRFVLYDDREDSETKGVFNDFTLSLDNFNRLTVPPNVWMAFQGVGGDNILLDITDLEHSPGEGVRVDLESIVYNW